jgi:hypothetical protein
VSKIMSILETIPLGRHYFEIAVVLRNSLLTSSMLCNTESWYNITKAEMNLFETIDEMLLRRILGAPRSTAKEMLYLELGCLPYREMVRKRRLMFLKYILHEKQESMIYKFLEAQIKNPTVKDWVTTVRKDLHELNLSVTFAEIKKMKKGSFKTMIRKSIAEKALQYLNEKKSSHSKVMNLKHEVLQMQTYLMPNKSNISKEEKQLIFCMRSEVTEVKMNFKRMYENYKCEVCDEEFETQRHVLECTKLLNMNENSEEISIPKYEHLLDGTPSEKINIARLFKANMNERKKFMDKRKTNN